MRVNYTICMELASAEDYLDFEEGLYAEKTLLEIIRAIRAIIHNKIANIPTMRTVSYEIFIDSFIFE